MSSRVCNRIFSFFVVSSIMYKTNIFTIICSISSIAIMNASKASATPSKQSDMPHVSRWPTREEEDAFLRPIVIKSIEGNIINRGEYSYDEGQYVLIVHNSSISIPDKIIFRIETEPDTEIFKLDAPVGPGRFYQLTHLTRNPDDSLTAIFSNRQEEMKSILESYLLNTIGRSIGRPQILYRKREEYSIQRREVDDYIYWLRGSPDMLKHDREGKGLIALFVFLAKQWVDYDMLRAALKEIFQQDPRERELFAEMWRILNLEEFTTDEQKEILRASAFID